MLDKFWGLFSHDVAIDLGTANTLVAVRGKGIIVREPSIVVRHKKSKQVLAVGTEAKKMWGKTPGTLEVVRPLRGGVIADFDAAEALLTTWIKLVHESQSAGWRMMPLAPRPRVIIGIPSGVTEVERRAVQEAALRAGARKAWLIEEAMAAAVGSEAPVDEPVGVLIVDIGGGTMEIAVISLAGVVVSRSKRIAGDAMDDAITNYFRLKHQLLIGPATAERVKIELGGAGDGELRTENKELRTKNKEGKADDGKWKAGWRKQKVEDRKEKEDVESRMEIGDLDLSNFSYPFNSSDVMVVRGRDLETGLPKSLKITSVEIQQALEPILMEIVTTVQEVIDEIPPELMVDILERGIILAGGGALVRGLDQLMAKQTKMPVQVADDPLTCVVRGCLALFDRGELLAKVRVTGGLR